jgi:hypothetical protein
MTFLLYYLYLRPHTVRLLSSDSEKADEQKQ